MHPLDVVKDGGGGDVGHGILLLCWAWGLSAPDVGRLAAYPLDATPVAQWSQVGPGMAP